eukprot:Phypoly_transcript_17296.p1 GENE.Phypoly_transcript_17296~~Phypoly_transcript_17296.p1  ORF type:complete len:127 (+),score=4.41 Phypoly_transcript_17296:60-440(+)
MTITLHIAVHHKHTLHFTHTSHHIIHHITLYITSQYITSTPQNHKHHKHTCILVDTLKVENNTSFLLCGRFLHPSHLLISLLSCSLLFTIYYKLFIIHIVFSLFLNFGDIFMCILKLEIQLENNYS